MSTTWSGRVIPSTGEEIGIEEIAPGVYRNVTRPVPAEPQAPTVQPITTEVQPVSGNHPKEV